MRIESKNSRNIFTQTSHSQQVFPPIRTSAALSSRFISHSKREGPTRAGPRAAPAPANYEPVCPPEISSCPLDPAVKVVSPWVYTRDAGCEFDCSWRIPENFVQLVEICWENELNVFTPRVLSGYFFPNQIGWTVREGDFGFVSGSYDVNRFSN